LDEEEVLLRLFVEELLVAMLLLLSRQALSLEFKRSLQGRDDDVDEGIGTGASVTIIVGSSMGNESINDMDGWMDGRMDGLVIYIYSIK